MNSVPRSVFVGVRDGGCLGRKREEGEKRAV